MQNIQWKLRRAAKMWMMLNEENTMNRNFNYVSRDLKGKKCSNKNCLKPQRKQHEDNEHYICAKSLSVWMPLTKKKTKRDRRSYPTFFFPLNLLCRFIPHAKSTKWKIPWIFITEDGCLLCECLFFPVLHSVFLSLRVSFL